MGINMVYTYSILTVLVLFAGYGAGHQHGKCKSTGDITQCLDTIQGSIADGTISQPFLPTDLSLSSYIDVEHTTSTIEFRVCCENETVEGKTDMYINPLDDTGSVESTADVRDDSTRKVEFWKTEMGTFHASDYPTGTYLTLIMVDPDSPGSEYGTAENPYLHNLVINIENGDFSTGTVLSEYAGSLPPDANLHNYFYLLYEHSSSIDLDSAAEYLGDNCGDRCLFDIDKFVSDNSLTLVGVNWFKIANDEYADYVYTTGDYTDADVCDEGWEDNCEDDDSDEDPDDDDDSGSHVVGSMILVVVSLFFTL